MANVLIIHGHENEDWTLSFDAEARCRQAIKIICSDQPFDRVICTGGLFSPKQQGVTIAAAMARRIREEITNLDIEEENESLTTIDNCEKVIQMVGKDNNFFVISSDYHALRTIIIWDLAGKKIKFVSAPGKKSIKKYLVEVVGIAVSICWGFGFKWPEMFFRKRARQV
ncbi:MAG: ElyC/SanA/YdcF family protein [Sphaerochaetaceae bacterium]